MHDHIAIFPNQLAHAVTFRTHYDCGRNRQIGLIHGNRAFGSSTEYPYALFLQFFDGRIDVGDFGHLHIFHSTGRGFRHRSCQTHAATLGNDHAMGAGTFRRPQNCAQIMRIGQFIANDDQRCFSPISSFLQNVINGVIHAGCRQSDDTLVGTGSAHHIQFPAIHGNDHRTGFLRLGCQTLQALIRVACCNKHFIQCSAATQSFCQGVSAFQLTLYLFPRLRGFPASVVFSHNDLSFLGNTFENTFFHYNRFSYKLQLIFLQHPDGSHNFTENSRAGQYHSLQLGKKYAIIIKNVSRRR